MRQTCEVLANTLQLYTGEIQGKKSYETLHSYV